MGSASPLDRLDEALVGVRRMLQRPGYRHQVMARLGSGDALSTIRTVRAVQRAEQAPSVRDIAETLGIDPSTASRFVEEAVKRGYLKREQCAQDRRRARVQVTPAGMDVLSRMSAIRLGVLLEVTVAWTPEDVTALVLALERLLLDFERLEEPT